MRYEGNIYRPPSEARSYLLQVTIGCAHNKCTFCSMFKDKKFRIRPMSEIFEDIEAARRAYNRINKIFLCDGDALCLDNNKLMSILTKINETFPECEKIGVYGSPQDVLRKSKSELMELAKAGISIIYIGAESGNDEILHNISKGATSEEIVTAVQNIEEAGIAASVTFISGIGGKENWENHAVDTGKMISKMGASYVSLLTLMLEPETQLYDQVKKGEFVLLTAEEVARESLLLLTNVDVNKKCVFRSNHASNYVSLRGDLPADKETMLDQLAQALVNKNMLKDERFRML